MKPVWMARTGNALDDHFLAYSQSTEEDAPFVLHDVAGSIAHVLGLHKAGLLSSDEAALLVAGLQAIATKWQDGTFVLDPALEDVHMNLEAALAAELGDVAKRLHTGRSRNDQVATCITLYARDGLLQVAQATSGLAEALAGQAETHRDTPWVARTHGQPAQPATLGFLLAAHAFRAQDLQKKALATFDAIGESPLGSGAIAGSTLPLDPDFTADLLGLRSPRNALLATGGRDSTLQTLQVCAEAGLWAASLAQDLLDLFTQNALHLPDGFTSGSSLMPQKRNPDALELVRGKGKALQGPLAAVTGIIAGMGLGYQRDLQATKPALVAGLTDAVATLDVLAACVQGARFDADRLTEDLVAPGITATDVAEALVAKGIPFREAYGIVAGVFQAVEAGAAPAEALAESGLDATLLTAAQGALVPEAARRNTLGGPASEAVSAALQGFWSATDALLEIMENAKEGVQGPRDLLWGQTPSLTAVL